MIMRPVLLCNSPRWTDFFYFWRNSPSSFTSYLDNTQRRTTVGRTPLDEWSARRRDLYLTTLKIHNTQTSMFPVGFEITVSVGERPQTNALDRETTGTAQMDGLLSQHWKRSDQVMTTVDVRARWQGWKWEFKKGFGCLIPSGHYTYRQEEVHYTDVQ
jgi:hypothetical protein